MYGLGGWALSPSVDPQGEVAYGCGARPDGEWGVSPAGRRKKHFGYRHLPRLTTPSRPSGRPHSPPLTTTGSSVFRHLSEVQCLDESNAINENNT